MVLGMNHASDVAMAQEPKSVRTSIGQGAIAPTYFALKPGCVIHPFDGGMPDQFIIETPDSRRFKLSGNALRILQHLDGGASVEDLSDQIPGIALEDLRAFIVTNYSQLLVTPSGEPMPDSGPACASSPRKALFASWTFIPQTITAAVSSRLSVLFQPVAAVLFLFVIIASHILIYSPGETGPDRLRGAHAALVVMLSLGSVIAHEFGHASALARYGGTPSSIGFGLYILLPVFYADVSQAWRLRRWQRVIVDLGGVYFQQLCFAAFAFCAILFRDPSMRAVCVAIDVMTFIALNPAFRFDGYWVIADWLGVADLHRLAGAYLRHLRSSLLGRRTPEHRYPEHLGRVKAAVFISYALLSNLFLAFVVLLNFRWAYSAVLGLYLGLPQLSVELVSAALEKHWLQTCDLAVACAFLLASGTTLMIGIYLQVRAVVLAAQRRLSFHANREPGERI
jgi:putative peptide zinc metalloprotease protein